MYQLHTVYMMMSSNGNIFHVTGPLWGESTGHWWIPLKWPVTRSFDVFFDLRLKKTLNNQAWRRCVDTSSCSWCRHCAEYSIGSRHELDWFDMGGKQFRLSFDLLMMCLCVTNVFGMFSVHSDDDMFSTSLNVCWADNITTEYLVSYRLDAVLTTTWAIIFTNAGSIVNSNLGNKLQWNQQNSYIFIKENSFENIVWKIADILSRPQCVDKQR